VSARIRLLVAEPEVIGGLRAHAAELRWSIRREEQLPDGLTVLHVLAADAPRQLHGRLVNPVIARNYNTGEVYVLSYGQPLDEALIAGLTGGT
jgi:hypothetical protein